MCDISGEQPITTQNKCDITAEQPITTRASVTHSSRFKTLLLKVKRLKNMMNLNTFPLKYLSMKRTNKGNYLALSVQSQVNLVKLVYIVDNI